MDQSSSFILGSGFSRAIHARMPTMPELATAVLQELGEDHSSLEPFGGNLERWMSFLAVDQPWLGEAANLRNKGHFLEAAAAVRDVIEESELAAIVDPPPIWLIRLVWTWCDLEASIFTFNYDTLIERCLNWIGRTSTLGDVYAAPLTERLPLGTHMMFASAPPRGPVLRLFKLHGSTNWGFGGLSGPASDPIVLTNERPIWSQPYVDDTPPPPRWTTRFDGLYPLIVPPTYSKGSYYNNSTLRGQWRRGADALATTTELTVMGYSFPAGDLSTREWVGTSLGTDSLIRIVDVNKAVATRLVAEFGDRSAVIDETGADAIENYVNQNCGDHLEWEIEEEDDNPPPRISLKVNGVEQLPQVVDHRPWGSGLDAAREWLHLRIEAMAPAIIDRAVGRNTSGLVREHREVVLPRGSKAYTH